jgi:tetratricopeptide (TPR) repeat protein
MLAQTFDLALRLHQAGNLQEAERLYRQILESDPQHIDALHLLGVIAGQSGKYEIAISHIRQALALKPDFALAHKNLGKFLEDQGKLHEAATSYAQALRCNPDYAEAHFSLGNVLRDQRKLEAAADCYRQAIRIKPEHVDAHNNLGNVLKELGRLDEAVRHYIRALEVKPDHFLAINNLGIVQAERDNWTDAAACFREAVRLKPDYAGAFNNLGSALRDQRKLNEATAAYQEAIRLQPDFAEAHRNLGMAWLLLGNLEKGWPEYEWRRKVKRLAYEAFLQPLWDGSSLNGKTTLLYAEQGLGDTLQFVRYAPLVKERGGNVVLECPAELVKLMRSCPGVDQIVLQGSPRPAFDVQAPLLSLPCILQTTLANIPSRGPYLSVVAEVIERWRQEIVKDGGGSSLKVGIVWQGNPRFAQPECRAADRRRSIPLAYFEALARVPGVRLFSLQKGYGTEQLVAWKERLGIIDLGARLADFTDTAALMMNLDLIISADTAPLHLAGALGRPVLAALPFSGCWRWLHDRVDSPWYPSMKLYRQRQPGDWQEVFARIAGDLSKLCRELVRPDPQQASAHVQLARQLKSEGKLEEAAASYRQALHFDAANFQAHNNLGNIFQDQGKREEAAACFQRALRLNPDYALAHYNLGNLLGEQLEEAIACYQRAIRLKPDFFQAHNNLGNVYKFQGRLNEALACYRHTLALNPSYCEAHNNLGFVLQEQGKLEEAMTCYRQALCLEPDYVEAHNNLGLALQEQGKLDEAEASYRRALSLQPDHPGVHNNLGNNFREQGRFEEAVADIREALRIEPNLAEAHKNLGMLYLQLGELDKGWAEFEWRQKVKGLASRLFPQSRWDGSSLIGKTILIHAEQGLGDTLQFIRYVPLVKRGGGQVLFECPPALVSIIRTCPGIDQIITQGGLLPPCDVHAPLLSMPFLLKTTPATIPYLSTEPAVVERWRNEITCDSALNVGIVWQGNPKYKADRRRSIPLHHFERLARVAGVRLLSLQVGPAAKDLATVDFPVTDLGSRFDPNSFADAAGAIKSLDLLITSDTSIPHLAGALGAPVWVVLCKVPDWRWLLKREDSPWYPTMRLFRQKKTPGDWDEVFRRMAGELEKMIKEPRTH